MLRTSLGKRIPENLRIGESWELADLPEDKTRIRNGCWAGMTLNQIPIEHRLGLFPDIPPSVPFPLLVKFLDAQDILSVQVHPDSETCRIMGRGDPKTECWYILFAGPDAAIYKGLKSGTTRDQLRQAILEGTVEVLLNRVPVHAGECHFIPAGTCHAIGAGMLIAEIQTPSDTTYRLFDWHRLDEQGLPRPLHVEDALQSIRYDQCPEDLTVRTTGILADCHYFQVQTLDVCAGRSFPLKFETTRILVGVSGSATIVQSDETEISFKTGDTALIPVNLEEVLKFDSDGRILIIRVKTP